MSRLYVVFLLLLSALPAFAAEVSFDGEWKVTWPCQGSAEQCPDGAEDVFVLDLSTKGEKVCGFHLATGHLGNRVDDGSQLDGKPTIVGDFHGDLAEVIFRSAWGATGKATLRTRGDELVWKITSQSTGESWLPDEAVLTRKSEAVKGMQEKCFAEAGLPGK